MSGVAIVGGGMLGLTLARDLARQGHRVTMLESAASPGGLAGTDTIGGYEWDRFYHVILHSDEALLGLLAELGLTDALRWGRTRTGFFTNGRLHSLSSAMDFARFPLAGPVGKARLAATILYASRIRDWERLEAIPVDQWLSRCSGRKVFDQLWLPLLRSKLGEHWREASAAFIWAIIQRLYGARRSRLKTEMFGYVEGGYRRILGSLVESVRSAGVAIRCRSEVVAVRRTARGGGTAIELASGERLLADAAVLTVPCGRVAALCPELSAAEQARLRSVRYLGVACGTLLLRRPLAGYYVTNITDPGLPFTGVIEMTALVDRARFGGHTLVYLPRYLGREDPAWQRPDEELRGEFLSGLGRMFPRVSADDVIDFKVSRAREVLALSTLHYSRDAMPAVRTSVPGIFVVNSAQIAAGTLNVNETLGVARAGARALAGLLPGTAASRAAA